MAKGINRMREKIVSLLCAIVPIFLGIGLPYLDFPGHHRFVNPFWSTVYGCGLWILDKLGSLRIQSPLGPIGLFVWSLAVSAALFLFVSKLQQAGHTRVRWVSFCLLGASCFCIVGLQMSMQPPLSNAPTFYRLFFVIW
jgi:hypothetical protein